MENTLATFIKMLPRRKNKKVKHKVENHKAVDELEFLNEIIHQTTKSKDKITTIKEAKQKVKRNRLICSRRSSFLNFKRDPPQLV